MTDFSVTDAATEGFRLAVRKPGVILAWAIVQLAVNLLIGVGLVLFVGPDMAKLGGPNAMAVLSDPALAAQTLGPALRYDAVTVPLTLIWAAVQICAVYRAVLRPEDKGLAYLKLGRDELRMAGLIVLFVLLALAGAIAVMAVLVGVAGAGGGGGASLLLVGAVIAAIIVAGWVMVRLSMAAPMTFMEGRITLWRSWAVTRGRGWGLFGAYLIAGVLAVVIAILVGQTIALLIGYAVTGKGLGGLYQNAFGAPPQSLAELFSAGRLAVLVMQSLFVGLAHAVWYAPAAEVYRMLRDPRPAAAVQPAAQDDGATARKGPWG